MIDHDQGQKRFGGAVTNSGDSGGPGRRIPTHTHISQLATLLWLCMVPKLNRLPPLAIGLRGHQQHHFLVPKLCRRLPADPFVLLTLQVRMPARTPDRRARTIINETTRGRELLTRKSAPKGALAGNWAEGCASTIGAERGLAPSAQTLETFLVTFQSRDTRSAPSADSAESGTPPEHRAGWLTQVSRLRAS